MTRLLQTCKYVATPDTATKESLAWRRHDEKNNSELTPSTRPHQPAEESAGLVNQLRFLTADGSQCLDVTNRIGDHILRWNSHREHQRGIHAHVQVILQARLDIADLPNQSSITNE